MNGPFVLRRAIVRAREIVGVSLLVVASLWSAHATPVHNLEDKVAKYEKRIAAVRGFLPADAVIRYSQHPKTSSGGEFYLARYCLAPIEVYPPYSDLQDSFRLVLVDVIDQQSPLPEAIECRGKKLRLNGEDGLVRDFGHGMYLLDRR